MGKKLQPLAAATHPLAGKPAGHIARKVRCFPAGKYLIYYCKTGRSIDVLHIFHGARDQKPSFRAKI